MDCIFCKITRHELSSEVIYEDKEVMVFKDIHPKAPIHHLVVPKTHIQSIAHLEASPGDPGRPRADHNEIISKLIYTAKKVAEDEGLAGYKLVFNVGREGGQVVDHLHLHLLGGWSNKDNPDKFRA